MSDHGDRPRDLGKGFLEGRGIVHEDAEGVVAAFHNGYQYGAGRQSPGTVPYPEGPQREAFVRGKAKAIEDVLANRTPAGPLFVSPDGQRPKRRPALAASRGIPLRWYLLGAALLYAYGKTKTATPAPSADATGSVQP